MATLRQRGSNWYLDIYQHGRRKVTSLGPNERLARLRLAEVQADIERGKAGFPVETPVTLRQRIETWLETHRANLAPSYHLRCTVYAERALELLDGERPLTSADLERYKAARLEAGVKTRSVNGELQWLKQIHGAHGQHGFRDVKPLKIRDAPPPRWLTHDEVARLLAAATERTRPYLEGYLYTGARREELVSVRWEDYDRERRTLRLPNLKTAGRRAGDSHRTIPVHPKLAAVLAAQEARGYVVPWPRPSSLHQLRKWCVVAARRARIEPLPRLHDLRHTFASHLAMAGVSLYQIGRLLGHSNPATTQRYAHLQPESLAGAVGLLPY